MSVWKYFKLQQFLEKVAYICKELRIYSFIDFPNVILLKEIQRGEISKFIEIWAKIYQEKWF